MSPEIKARSVRMNAAFASIKKGVLNNPHLALDSKGLAKAHSSRRGQNAYISNEDVPLCGPGPLSG
eukprot:9416362-Karenia_brevis.AAC.1